MTTISAGRIYKPQPTGWYKMSLTSNKPISTTERDWTKMHFGLNLERILPDDLDYSMLHSLVLRYPDRAKLIVQKMLQEISKFPSMTTGQLDIFVIEDGGVPTDTERRPERRSRDRQLEKVVVLPPPQLVDPPKVIDPFESCFE